MDLFNVRCRIEKKWLSGQLNMARESIACVDLQWLQSWPTLNGFLANALMIHVSP